MVNIIGCQALIFFVTEKKDVPSLFTELIFGYKKLSLKLL